MNKAIGYRHGVVPFMYLQPFIFLKHTAYIYVLQALDNCIDKSANYSNFLLKLAIKIMNKI